MSPSSPSVAHLALFAAAAAFVRGADCQCRSLPMPGPTFPDLFPNPLVLTATTGKNIVS